MCIFSFILCYGAIDIKAKYHWIHFEVLKLKPYLNDSVNLFLNLCIITK